MQAIGHQPMTLTEPYHLQKRVEILIVPGLWAFAQSVYMRFIELENACKPHSGVSYWEAWSHYQ